MNPAILVTTTTDLIGIWHGASMFRRGRATRETTCETLVFRNDGLGFLDFFDRTHRFSETFRWTLSAETEVRIAGERFTELAEGCQKREERESTLNAVVSFRIAVETTKQGRTVRVLRLATSPWPGSSRNYRFGGRGDIYGSFQAPAFLRDTAPVFEHPGKEALAREIAKRLRRRGFAVGGVGFAYFGCSYNWGVRVEGRNLAVCLGWAEEKGGWCLRLCPPRQSNGSEIEALREAVSEILQGIESASEIAWERNEALDLG